AGEYDKSDGECQRFLPAFPKSAAAAEVVFRQAENAFFRVLAAEAAKADAKEISALRAEAVKRYQALISAHPDFPRANNARFALGVLSYRQGEYAKAQAAFEAIPPGERGGELAAASYLLADCVLRQI